jgi:PIN domain nuclease of toxin-antitoxin system
MFADPKLSRAARTAISDEAQNDVFVSAASAWEITTKYRIGKLAGARVVAEDVSGAIAAEGFNPLAVTVLHAERAGGLASDHRDPFNRMLIAQAISDDLALVSNERVFEAYGVKRLW